MFLSIVLGLLNIVCFFWLIGWLCAIPLVTRIMIEEEDGLTVGTLLFIPFMSAFWWKEDVFCDLLHEIEDAFGLELGDLEEKLEELMEYKLFDSFKS